jgi:hypothetical protein
MGLELFNVQTPSSHRHKFFPSIYFILLKACHIPRVAAGGFEERQADYPYLIILSILIGIIFLLTLLYMYLRWRRPLSLDLERGQTTPTRPTSPRRSHSIRVVRVDTPPSCTLSDDSMTIVCHALAKDPPLSSTQNASLILGQSNATSLSSPVSAGS